MSAETDLYAELQQLKQRQAELESRLLQLETQARPHRLRPTWLNPQQQTMPDSERPDSERVKSARRLENLLGLQGFSWLGILALVSGLALFVRYAYLEGWLGPIATLLAGFGLSLALLGAGEWTSRHATYRTWAHALMGGGVALLYFLVYAAYHFPYFRAVTHLTPLSDTLLLMGVVALAIFLALRRRSQSLASRAFVLGFVTSLFSQDFQYLTLFYNLFLSLGLIAVAGIARWPSLAVMGLLGSWVLHGIWIFDNPAQAGLAQGLSLGYVLLYSALDEYLKPQEPTPKTWLHQLLAPLNLLGYATCSLLCQAQLSDSTGPVWQVLYLLLSLGWVLWLSQAQRLRPWLQSLQLSVAVGLFYLALAQAEVSYLALALAGLGCILLALGRYLEPAHSDKLTFCLDALAIFCLLRAAFLALAEPLLGLSLAALAAALTGASQAQSLKLRHGPQLALGVVGLLVPYLLFWTYPEAYLKQSPGLISMSLFCHALSLTLLWAAPLLLGARLASSWQHALLWPVTLLSAAWLQFSVFSGWGAISWALAGAFAIGTGFVLKHPVLRYQGMVLLLAAGIKIYFWDLQGLSLGYRIVSLLVLGVLLLGMALLYTRLQGKPKQESDR